jgi:hypothetical protein
MVTLSLLVAPPPVAVVAGPTSSIPMLRLLSRRTTVKSTCVFVVWHGCALYFYG